MTPRRALPIALLVIVVAAPFLLAGLGAAGFDDPGEGMHAQIARELLERGDPTRLTLNGAPYLDKPPLLYYLLAGAFSVGGATEPAARTVSALAALVAVGATAWLGAHLLGPAGGALAGLALLSSGLFFVYGRYVRPEALFVAALACGFALALAGVRRGDRRLAGWGLVAFGLAGLAKDPLGVLAPPLALGIALVLAARARPLARWLPWPALVAAAVLGLGWWALAEWRTPGSAWYAFVDNKLLNIAGLRVFPDEDVPLSALEFLVVCVLGAIPWSVGAIPAIVDLARRRAWRDPDEVPWVALALWAVAVIGLTALSRFRLPHYGLPAYPALALLAARAWRERPRALAALHAAIFAALAAGLGALWLSDGAWFMDDVIGTADVATRKAAALAHAALAPPWSALRPLVGETAAILALGAVLIVLTVVVGPFGRRHAAAAAIAAATMLATLPAFARAHARVADHRSVAAIAELIKREAAPGDVVAHEGPLEASGALDWYSGHRPVIVDGRRSVLGFAAARAHTGGVFWDAPALRAAWSTGRRIWLVSVRAPEASIAPSLPGARLLLATGGHWLYVSPSVVGARGGSRDADRPS